MKSLVVSVCCIVLLMACPFASSQVSIKGVSETQARAKAAHLATNFRPSVFRDAGGVAMPYRYFDPTASQRTLGKVPVILYLHGEDEAGQDNTSQVTKTECATVWIEPDHLVTNPAYVLAPQIARGTTWVDDLNYNRTLALLHWFLQEHPLADANRVYLVGFSMGADGVYKLLLKNPLLFAAAMPISGSAEPYLNDTTAWAALKNTPVIIVHAYDDKTVPVTAAMNAAAALQAGGNTFLGHGAPAPAMWSPNSTRSPHDAWYTAFEKFDVIYNSLFLGDLTRTHDNQIDITRTYTSRKLGNGITQVWDYALGTSLVIERPDKAVIIDTTMGHGSIYQYIRDNVLVNKDVPMEVFITHFHQDHTLGLKSFIGSSQLRKVYAGRPDDELVKGMMGPDAAKVTAVKDGDRIALGGSEIEVIGVPGHTAGSIVMKYGGYLFTGDSIGTGYVGVGAFSVEQYIASVQHLLDRMGSTPYTIYGGHTGELRGTMTDQYVHDLLRCAQGVVDGSLPFSTYWRGHESSTRKVTTYGNASITFDLDNVHRIPAALSGLRLSRGALYPGFSPEFSPVSANTPGFRPSLVFYNTWIDPSERVIQITPSVLDPSANSISFNGQSVPSGMSQQVRVAAPETRVSIRVTERSGETRTYWVNVIRGTP